MNALKAILDEYGDDHLGAAKAIGIGLMRGNRAELRLGYDWRAAYGVVEERYNDELSAEQKLWVMDYLRGFEEGLKDEPGPHAQGVMAAAAEERWALYPAVANK